MVEAPQSRRVNSPQGVEYGEGVSLSLSGVGSGSPHKIY